MISNTTFVEADAIAAPSGAAADKVRMYMDSTSKNTRLSENGGGYDDIVLAGKVQSLTGKTLTTPTISSFVNAGHNHSNAAGAGQLSNSALTSGVYAAITGLGAQSQDLDLNSNKIANLGAPVAANDAARKAYVDSVAQGLKVKESCRLATAAVLAAHTAAGSGIGKTLTANANGALSVDGVAAALNDRVLVKDQAASHVDHGLYKVTQVGDGSNPWILTRATDFDEGAEVTGGAFTFIEEGTANADSGWVLTTNNPITVDTTAMAFAQFSGAGQITAGAGLTKTGNTLDVGAGTGISVAADSVAVDQAFTATWTGVHTFNNDMTIGASGANTLLINSGWGSNLVPALDNSISLGSASKRLANVISNAFKVFAAAGEANPTVEVVSGSLSLGGGGASALDVVVSRGAANRLDLAAGDSLNLVSGDILMGGTIVVNSSRNVVGVNALAQTLLPDGDNTRALGSEAARWSLVRSVVVTTGDLNLQSDDGSAKWTIQEQPNEILLHNRRTGKTYRMLMEEV